MFSFSIDVTPRGAVSIYGVESSQSPTPQSALTFLKTLAQLTDSGTVFINGKEYSQIVTECFLSNLTGCRKSPAKLRNLFEQLERCTPERRTSRRLEAKRHRQGNGLESHDV